MSINRSRLTTLAACVLNLLRQHPMHPYEMRMTIQHRDHGHIVRLRGASLYDTVDRLAKGGLIEATETSRDGRRPERTVYKLTEAGAEEFEPWLKEGLERPVNDYPHFAAVLAFTYGTRKTEVVEALRRRATMLESEIAATKVKLRATVETYGLPRIFVIEEEYLLTMKRAELEWIGKLVEDLLGTDLWPDLSKIPELISEFERRTGGGARAES